MNALNEKIPATVITGFLGAGKTTMIRHLLENANGRRIALVINEFGDVGVDGEILKACGSNACGDEDIVELSNGCICCTVAEDFVPTIEKLLARPDKPDHIVIETSGLALPQPLVRAFNWPEIATKVTVDGVVTVVDGKAVEAGLFASDIEAVDAARKADDMLDHETPLSELFEDQIACADMIVVNKSDLLGDEGASLSADLAGEARDGVQVLRASHGKIPVDVLLGQAKASEGDMAARHEHHHHHDDDHHHHDDHHGDDHDHHHHHDHDHDDFQTFVASVKDAADKDAYLAHVAELMKTHGILRLKGFVGIAGKPMRLVIQAVGPRVDGYFDKWPDARREGQLVVIGQTGLDEAAITKALNP